MVDIPCEVYFASTYNVLHNSTSLNAYEDIYLYQETLLEMSGKYTKNLSNSIKRGSRIVTNQTWLIVGTSRDIV